MHMNMMAQKVDSLAPNFGVALFSCNGDVKYDMTFCFVVKVLFSFRESP